MLVIAERNREGMKYKQDGLISSAGTRMFEYCSETVLSLEAEKYDTARRITPVKVSLAKNRNGAAGGHVNLSFRGAKQTYTEEGDGDDD